MRHIEKCFDAPVVLQHKRELEAVQLDKKSLLKRKETEVLSGKTLYQEQVRSTRYVPHWNDLQAFLNQEQGGVCCYCGSKLFFPNTQYYSVEHVKPRSKYPELVGEYENLLLSCHSSEKERKEIKESALPKKEKRMIFHCDEFKDNNELHYSPLDKHCEEHFTYKLDGEVVGNDSEAEEDIKALNLQCKALVERRRKKIQALLFTSVNSPEIIDTESLKIYRQEVEKLDANGNHREFYFVIADILDQYLGVR